MNTESKTQTLNLSDDAIENPKRTALIISIADHLQIPRDEISGLILDALDADEIHPYQTILDHSDADSERTFIALLHTLIGSDDDHDDAVHDVDHAVQSFDVCDEHPTVCSTCCDAH